MNLDLDIHYDYRRGITTNSYTGQDYEQWLEETPFDKFLESIMKSKNWSVHIGMRLFFDDDKTNVEDFILKHANEEQRQRYVEYLRSGIEELREKIPDLFEIQTKSARNV